MSKIRCLIVDDHPLYRRGLAEALHGSEAITVIGEAASVEDALSAPETPDVVLLDLGLPGASQRQAVEAVLGRWTGASVLVVTASENRRDLLEAMAGGASGYLTKHATQAQLEEAISQVAIGEMFVTPSLAAYLLEEDGEHSADEWSLSPREREILRMVAEGDRDRDIAERLVLSIKTVQSHLNRIRDKTGRRKRAELTMLAVEKGLIRTDGGSE